MKTQTTAHTAIRSLATMLALIALVNLMSSGRVSAATVSWTGADGTWAQPDADSFTAAYNAGDDVVFADTGAGTVTLSGSLTPGAIAFNNTTGNDYQLTGTAIGGTGSITLNGSGEVWLNNAQNTYTGATTVNAGRLESYDTTTGSGSDYRLPALTALTIGGTGTFHYRNSEAIGSLAGSGTISNSLGNTNLFLGYDNTDTTFSGTWLLATGGGGTFAKMGTGTFTIESVPNKGMQLFAGTVRLAGASGGFGHNSPLIRTGGVLLIDNTADNFADRLGGPSSGETPNLAGGELKVLGNSSAATEVHWGRGFTTGTIGNPTVTLVPGSGQTVLIRQGHNGSPFNIDDGAASLVRGDDLGNTSRFQANAQGGVTIARNMLGGAGMVFADDAAGNGGTPGVSILRHMVGDADATGNGTGFVTYDRGTDHVQDTDDPGIRLLTAGEYSATIVDGEAFATPSNMQNKRIAGSIAGLNSSTRVTSLILDGTASLAGSGTLIVQSGDIMATGNGGTISVNSLTAGITPTSDYRRVDKSEQITLITPDSDDLLSISSTISNTSVADADSGLVKNGYGTAALTGANSYTGRTIINRGALRADDGAGLPSGSRLVFGGDGVLESSDTFARSLGAGTTNVQWDDDASGGFAAYGGIFDITLNGGTGAVTWDGTANFIQGHRSLILGSVTANNTVDFKNDLILGAFNPEGGDFRDSTDRVVTVIDNPLSTADKAIISGIISGTDADVGFRKEGNGLLVLSNANTYVGPTVVAGGTLLIDGSVTSNSITVESGATLGGSGSASALISVGAGATLAPGASYGAMTASSGVDFDAASTFAVEVGGLVAGSSYDQLIVTAGDVDLNGATLTIIDEAFTASYGDVLYIIDNQGAGATNGIFNYADNTLAGVFGGRRWFITYDAIAGLGLAGLDGGNDVALYAVPEPTSVLLLGLAGLLALRRRQ